MQARKIDGIDEMKEAVGAKLGPSEWREVTQEDVNTFADLSDDHQWIHVDVERANAESPFGGPIAHGNLTLSMIDGFRPQLMEVTGFQLAVNYGWNKVRFPAPVPVGTKIRVSAEFASIDEVGDGWYQAAAVFTVEVEGSEKPCCVAEHVARFLAG